MLLTSIWSAFILVSFIISLFTGTGSSLAPALMEGAQAGMTVSLSIAGGMCLWSGIGSAMRETSMTDMLASILDPLLKRLFPTAGTDREFRGFLASNFCANLLGLGNAATPMGIRAAIQLQKHSGASVPSAELSRLVVMNTASIQLIPANVAALRAGLGADHPFDILPAVWITSLFSVSVGLIAVRLMDRGSKHD